MKRDWAPGDVAMVTAEWKRGCRQSETAVKVRGGWQSLLTNAYVDDRDAKAVRPLVVIDPADAEAVADLARMRQTAWDSTDPHTHFSAMQAALREFADPKPPKPAEPTGLGAVVQDARGRTYVRVNRVPGYPWMSTETEALSPLAWVDLDDAAEVLSEGVES